MRGWRVFAMDYCLIGAFNTIYLEKKNDLLCFKKISYLFVNNPDKMGWLNTENAYYDYQNGEFERSVHSLFIYIFKVVCMS